MGLPSGFGDCLLVGASRSVWGCAGRDWEEADSRREFPCRSKEPEGLRGRIESLCLAEIIRVRESAAASGEEGLLDKLDRVLRPAGLAVEGRER